LLVTHEARHAGWADRVVFLHDGAIVDQTAPIETPLIPIVCLPLAVQTQI
jgi:putative ABC transport system ATP-binding protein